MPQNEEKKMISKEEFDAAMTAQVEKVIAEKKKDNPKILLAGMAAIIQAHELSDRLFKDSDQIAVSKRDVQHAMAEVMAEEDPEFTVVCIINIGILGPGIDSLFATEEND